MRHFTTHTIQSAPESTKPILEQLQQGLGFVPNLAATMAGSPSLLEAYVGLNSSFGRGSFSPVERELVLMTTSYENACSYCMAVHSTFAKVHGASELDLNAVRAGKLPADTCLAALVNFTRQVVRKKGQVSNEDIQSFLEAGFSEAQILEVLIGVSQGSLASLVHHMTGAKLDEGFQAQEWTSLSLD
jgi:uncharacterized peroxidase-related enzyme